uniref:Calcineurin-like phosphoesterase domain-containing protein n=1 Tax=Timema shepardi TaxID=629360 RepID=A0A7R9G3E4_TIMSH|nr:unnamed protein product [Timema shepardi]
MWPQSGEMEHVRNLSEEAHRQGSNYTIWFGHYPTSCILTPGPGGVRALIGSHREGLVYLCGHYHTLGGMVSNMYTLQQAGFLELELGDWKDNRLYRVAAVDHGLFSFIDVHHRDWPVILITNPKHTLYKMPTREPLNRMRNSTHIRMLIFSLSHIVDVQVKVDEEGWRPCTEVKGPLYVAMWEPNKYAQGLHYIHVHVEDGDGRVKTITQPFSLDDTRLGFHLLPRFVLMSNITNKYQKPKLPLRCLQCWLQKLWILGTVDRIFYPLVLYALYLTVGPWSVGEVIEGYTGIIFAWGTIINGVYLPGSFTYAYGFLQVGTNSSLHVL